MLISRNLDDQRYEDIVQEAKERLPWLCPVWTDYNAHDPGITVMELMAWYKEMQQFHMNQVTPAMKQKLLKLVGGQLWTAAPARCAVYVDQTCPARPALARLTTPQEISFELLEPIPKERATLDRILVETGGGRWDVASMISGNLPFQPFSIGDSGESTLLLGFGSVPPEQLRLWVEIPPLAGSPRPPHAPGMTPPRQLEWELMGLGPVELLQDETWSLSNSGYVTFSTENWPKGEEDLYWLRVRLLEPGCEENVRIGDLRVNRYEVAQQVTRSRSQFLKLEGQEREEIFLRDSLALWGELAVFLREEAGWKQILPLEDERLTAERRLVLDGRGCALDGGENLMISYLDPVYVAHLLFDTKGRPGESLYLNLGGDQALEEDLVLMCSTLERDGVVRPALWHAVEDLTVCGPRDRVFLYHPEEETISFGDGLHGAVPAAGTGSVLVAGLVLSSCDGGNIPGDAQLRFVGDGCPVENSPASGGHRKEQVNETRIRILQKLSRTKKCLSAQDFEDRAMETPGLRVAVAKALPDYVGEDQGVPWHPAAVTLVVLPAGEAERPQPDRRFLEAVEQQLERYRPVCVQTRVIGPRYVPISLSVRLWVSHGVTREMVWEALQQRFTVSQSLIGATVTLDSVATCLQRIPGVLQVKQLELRDLGAGTTCTSGGDMRLVPDAIPYWKDLDLELTKA